MANNPLENIFNLLKEAGNFSEYDDYLDYREKKYGIPRKKLEETQDQEKQAQIEKSYQEFKDKMPPKERQRYRELFDE